MIKESVDLPGELDEDDRDEAAPISQWVAINLPWRASGTSPEYKTLYSENEAFLAWYREESVRMFGTNMLGAWAGDRITAVCAAASELTQRERYALPQWLADVMAKYSDDSDLHADIRALAGHRHKAGLETAWSKDHPKIAEWNARQAALREAIKLAQFSSHPLCRPGTLIELREPIEVCEGEEPEWKAETKRYLIGDINPAGGLCDDCAVHPDTIVIRCVDLNKIPLVADILRRSNP